MNLDPLDGRPVEVILNLEKLKSDYPDGEWYHPEIPSLWRFGPLMAMDITNPEDAGYIPEISVGRTPLINYDHHPLAKQHSFSLSIKDEGEAHQGYGSNPTGSFKDRGMVMVVSMAKKFGLQKLVVPTQGNAGDSLAYFADKIGFEAVIIMPDDTPSPIIESVAAIEKRNPKIKLHTMKGTIREAGQIMKEQYVPQGYFNVATFQEPGWRIEGKKSLGLELAEPKADGEPWKLPDVIIYPTGGGTGILGMWKAFDELEALGMIDSKRPKIIGVQSEETSPVVDAIRQNLADVPAIDPGWTTAPGLNVAGGVGLFKVIDIIRKSGGTALAIPESRIKANTNQLYAETDWYITTEGAATLAALDELVADGFIRQNDHVVACNTCTLKKYFSGSDLPL